MLPKEDPFEEFKRLRSIELLEARFKEKTVEKRERLKKILCDFKGDESLETKVEEEMNDFFDESKKLASTVFEQLDESEEGEENTFERQIEDIFRESENTAKELISNLRERNSVELEEALDTLLEKPLQDFQNLHETRIGELEEVVQHSDERKEEECVAAPEEEEEKVPAEEASSRPSMPSLFRGEEEKASLLDRIIFTSRKIDALLEILVEKELLTVEELAQRIHSDDDDKRNAG